MLGSGLFFYLIGFLAENPSIGTFAMELVYAGLIVLFLGWRMMWALLFRGCFFCSCGPMDSSRDVAFQLRLFMSTLSHHTLSLIGVSNVLNGTAIMSPPDQQPPFAIDIADPCSGIRSLFALVMMATLAAFVLYRRLWQQVIIILLSVPLVILGNLVRILMLTLASIHFGEKFALGQNDHPSWFHEGAGYVVYLVNFGSLLTIGWLLTKISPDRGEPIINRADE